MIVDIFLSIFLVLLNGFFVAAEFAIVKVRVHQLQLNAQSGSLSSRMALHITSHLDAYLAATQLGITIASIGLGWVAEETFAEIIGNIMQHFNYNGNFPKHEIAIILAFAMVTFLHVVFGELAPKSVSIRYPLRVTLITALPLRIFYYIFIPFIWVFNGFANLILRMIGIRHNEDKNSHSEEELRLLITESREEGEIDTNEYELIQNVFEFDNRVVKEVMVPRVNISAISYSLSLEEIIDVALREKYSRFPVYEENIDQVRGIIHTKDLLKLLREKNGKKLSDIIRPVIFIPATKSIVDLLREFQKFHMEMAIVVDEFGSVNGLVTLEDIVEEIVGEIEDEFDEEVKFIESISENEFLVQAQSTIIDLNKALPIALPTSEHYDTLAGLVSFLFQRIPEPGESIISHQYEFTIMKKSRFTILQVKLRVVEG